MQNIFKKNPMKYFWPPPPPTSTKKCTFWRLKSLLAFKSIFTTGRVSRPTWRTFSPSRVTRYELRTNLYGSRRQNQRWTKKYKYICCFYSKDKKKLRKTADLREVTELPLCRTPDEGEEAGHLAAAAISSTYIRSSWENWKYKKLVNQARTKYFQLPFAHMMKIMPKIKKCTIVCGRFVK